MTKSTPPATRRSSSRITAKAATTTTETQKSVTKVTTKQTLIRKMKKKVVIAVEKGSIINIRDFKKQSGKTMYLVHRDGPASEDTWETEDMIESLDVLSGYQQKVLEESGYAINGSQEQQQHTMEEGSSSKRPSRASKIRAVIALKQQPEFVDDDDDDSENSTGDTSRKSIKSNGGTRKPANKRSGNSNSGRRKTKAQILLEAQHEEQLKRQKLRQNLNSDEIICQLDHLNEKECCLQCSNNVYRRALERNDLDGFKAALEEHIPSYSFEEDKPNGLAFTEYTIVLGREKFAEVMEEYCNKPNNDAKRLSAVPTKYKVYDGGNTGRNHRIGEYFNRNFRKVEEARGNRVGNSAFYRDEDVDNPKKSFLNVEDKIIASQLRAFMPYICKPSFQNETVIENYLVHFRNGSNEAYFAVSAGSRRLARALIQHVNSAGRSTFNHLHEEVLKFENGETLTSYRKTQILKMASDASNVTPYHCAAINPSATYLTEFYEALDPAERLETDAYGRSVAFYAAVSETTACLEFLHSKGFSLTLVDKYKISPIVQAARFGRSHNVEFLIKHLGGGDDEVTETSATIFQSLLRNKRTALHYAAYFGHAETCRILIKYGAPVDCVESLDKQTPLLYAAKNGNVDCVRVLIEEGKANPEKGDKFSRTALHYAAMNGHTEVVKYLLSQGVDSNSVDSSNNSPVHFAAAFGYIKILHLLIEYGSADPSTSNVWRSTPCSVANMKGHISIVKYLLNLSHRSIDVNFKDQNGYVMLQHCIGESISDHSEKETNIKKAELLLSMNADANSANLQGDTSLHTLAANKAFIKCTPMDWEPFYPVNTTYEQSTKITFDNLDGIQYQQTLAKLLIQRGADLTIKNADGETALALAMRHKHHYLVATLIEAGAKFWEDKDHDGNNFFHYFGKFIGFIDGLQPHYLMDFKIKERHEEAAKQIWNAIGKNYASHMAEIKKLINARNNEGRTPLIYAVLSTIKSQREAMIREKRLIHTTITVPRNARNNNNSYKSFSNAWYPSKRFKEHTLMIDVELGFTFRLWLKYMTQIVNKFKPDMNAVVGLPKDFKKKNPNAKKSEYPAYTGYTALHFAAQTQCVDFIKFFLRNGSDPNIKVQLGDKILSGDTPIIIAYHHKKDLYQEVPDQSLESTEQVKKKFNVTKPDFKEMLNETIEVMLSFNACPFTTNATGSSALLKASSSMDVKNLERMCTVTPSANTDVNTENEQGQTALTLAVDSLAEFIKTTKKPDVTVVKSLLKANANPNVQYENGDTALMKVIRTSHIPLIEILLENSIIPINHNLQNKKYETALIIACKLNVVEVILHYLQYLRRPGITCELNILDGQMGTALSYAAKNGNLQIVNELLSLGANPNFSHAQHVPLIEAVGGLNIDVVEAILKSGAHVNEQDQFGNSALHIAITLEKHRIVQLLLQHGADYNLTNGRKQTSLHLAVDMTKKQTNRSFRVERLLIKAGANMNAADFFGRTPLHYVFVNSNLIPITRNTAVISKKVKQISKEMKIEQDRKKSLCDYAKKFDFNEFNDSIANNDSDYLSNWMKEAKKVQMDKAEKEEAKKKDKKKKNIFDEEEDVVVLDEEKDMLKVYYSYGWETQTANPERFDPIDILKYLSDFEGLNFDVKDDFGRTPLHYAACVGAFSCTSLLIDKKVDINAVDSDNNGVLQLALRNNYVDYSVMLCNFGATVNNDIVLKDGNATSTFGFSLSQSLINMAYLIMERGVTLIESIRDALKNGKFHMVEILLESAKDEALSETLQAEGHNMWHVISDFKPFNSEIWEEYVEDIIERLLKLNLSVSCKDISNRTPIHYAAKHGQTVLLQHLLAMPNMEINIIDMDGNIELDYAVESGKIESIRHLLLAGAKVTNPAGFKKESLVLKSVQAYEFSITKLLLKYGASVDEDSAYRRINAVMVACQKKDIKMLKLLIEHGADLNKPCHVERKDFYGKKYTVLLHPIFVASAAGPLILEAMLQAGANPNVYGPDSEPEHGRSCFMYNVALNSYENQELLLKCNHLDLNLIDAKTSRTIFYQFFFGKMKYGHNFRDTTNIDYHKLTFNDAIYEKMIQQFKPEVNHIDKVTGMTPLELAVREKNLIIIERLLSLGTNINIESCCNTTEVFVASNIMNPTGRKLPAVLHAIIQNNIDVLRFVCEKAQVRMNWLWHDEEKHNVLSYIIGSAGGYSHENIAILEYVIGQMDSNTFKKLLQMRDIRGKSPIQLAHQRRNKDLYETMIRFEPACAIAENDHHEESDNFEEDMPMDVDYISTQQVDEDAQIEREALQKEKDLEKAKKNSLVTKKKDDTVKVDSYSNLEKVGYVVLDENNQPYDIMLLKVELRAYGVYADTTFYKMSVIHNKVLDLYILWTRWGPYGQEGQHQKTPYLKLEEAIAEFKSIFRSKTANTWEDRLTSFVQKQGRYDILKTAHHPRDVIIKDFDFLSSTVSAQLPREIADVMRLICNYNYLSRVYSDSAIDMPLGQVPQRTIEKARQILKEVLEMSKKYKLAKSNYTDRTKIQEAKTWEFKIAQKCVEYAHLLPRPDYIRQPIRSLFSNNNQHLKEELSRIEDLSYVGFAANVILAAKHHINDTNPLEYVYHTLNCSLRNITFENQSSEYQLIKNYMESTSSGNHELVHLFAVNRAAEEARFRPFEKEVNRRLLWHGSRVGNFMGILKQGLRVCPRTSPNNGAMLGNGIYFADTFAKSLNYSTENYGAYRSAYKLLLLCEVALGSKMGIYENNSYAYGQQDQEKNLDSMKGEGSNIPDPDNEVHDSNGVCIPMGPCILYTRPASSNNNPGIFGVFGSSNVPFLNHNEFAVYDDKRVKIRYLLIVREPSSCFLCFTPDNSRSSLKPLREHDVKKYDYAAFNGFEGEVIKAYLSHENKSSQDIFDEGLDEFIESGHYKKKWDIPLELRKESKVCSTCAQDVTTILLEKKMTSSDIDIPESLQTRPQCKYGKECRTQGNIHHAKKYKHWLAANTSEETKVAVVEEVIDDDTEDEENSSVETEDEDDDDTDSMDTDEE